MDKKKYYYNSNEYKLFLLDKSNQFFFVKTFTGEQLPIFGNSCCWVLPIAGQKESHWFQTSGNILVSAIDDGFEITFNQEVQMTTNDSSRPECDIFGNRFIFDIEDGEILSETLAHFYWDTILPCVIEKTKARDYPDSNGYVVSTLKEGEYAGTYPDVDHEFQCKGRLALGGDFEREVVQRMLNLQFKMMKEDPNKLWRNPCSIQPNGDREYHIRRDSLDGKNNAEMFLVSGNIEVIETAWLYYAKNKEILWLEQNIENLEGAASLIELLMDNSGRLWSDVFYEDQVIKDGMECMSAVLAVNSFRLLADLEKILKRKEETEKYILLAEKIQNTLIQEAPIGFWDSKNERFIDWIDRNGESHDHLHLLANILPVHFQMTDETQTSAVNNMIKTNFDKYQRFPTFLSPVVEEYTDSEIGDGGPYDLCAAGRYWCWDATYWSGRGEKSVLLDQLLKVSEQAKIDDYKMGERYDMNHIYYIDDKNWHGAPHYYEYPNVYAWVLIHEYIGIKFSTQYDLVIAPKIASTGKVILEGHNIEYIYDKESFTLKNLSDFSRTFKVDLSALFDKDFESGVVILGPHEATTISKSKKKQPIVTSQE